MDFSKVKGGGLVKPAYEDYANVQGPSGVKEVDLTGHSGELRLVTIAQDTNNEGVGMEYKVLQTRVKACRYYCKLIKGNDRILYSYFTICLHVMHTLRPRAADRIP